METGRRVRGKSLEPPPSRFEGTAARYNALQAERNPLFAAANELDQVAQRRTARDYERSEAEHHERARESRKRQLIFSRRCRAEIRRRDPEAYRALQRRWAEKFGPRTHEYRADFWGNALRKMLGGRYPEFDPAGRPKGGEA